MSIQGLSLSTMLLLYRSEILYLSRRGTENHMIRCSRPHTSEILEGVRTRYQFWLWFVPAAIDRYICVGVEMQSTWVLWGSVIHLRLNENKRHPKVLLFSTIFLVWVLITPIRLQTNAWSAHGSLLQYQN